MQSLDALSALSQETRLDIFRLLTRAEPDGMCAGEIADAVRGRQNTVSTNLAILARAGLVRSVREGRSIRYFADLEGMRALLSFLTEECCDGNPAACAPMLDIGLPEGSREEQISDRRRGQENRGR